MNLDKPKYLSFIMDKSQHTFTKKDAMSIVELEVEGTILYVLKEVGH